VRWLLEDMFAKIKAHASVAGEERSASV